MSDAPFKVFGIGLSRTGTKSLTRALQILGWDVRHFPHDDVTHQELLNGDVPKTLLGKCDGITDTPAVMCWRQLSEVYPDAKFIWTTRTIADWLHSCEEHWKRTGLQVLPQGARPFAELVNASVYGCLRFHKERFTKTYFAHGTAVTSWFKQQRHRLLTYDLCDGAGWGPLCEFLGVDVPRVKFPWVKGSNTLDVEHKGRKGRTTAAKPKLQADPAEVDVMLPYRHNLRWLDGAIESVLGQEGVRVTVHCVNDAMQADDKWVRLKYQHDDRVKWYRNAERVGPSVSSNRLVAGGHCKSRWLAVQDSDDVSLRGRLARAVAVLEEEGADVLGAGTLEFLEKGCELPQLLARDNQPRYSTEAHILNPTMVVRREFFERINGFSNHLSVGDTDFVMRCNADGAKVVVQQDLTVLHRLHGGSLTHNDETGTRTEFYSEAAADLNRRRQLLESGKVTPEQLGALNCAGGFADATT